MAYAARRLTRRVTWYLSLGPTRLAVDVQGVETITADDTLTARAGGSVPVDLRCSCNRTFRTKPEAVAQARAHAAVARAAYADFGRRTSDDDDVVGHFVADVDEPTALGEAVPGPAHDNVPHLLAAHVRGAGPVR